MVVARRQMKKTYMSPLPAMSDPEGFHELEVGVSSHEVKDHRTMRDLAEGAVRNGDVSCLASAKDACISFAEQKCIPSFAGAESPPLLKPPRCRVGPPTIEQERLDSMLLVHVRGMGVVVSSERGLHVRENKDRKEQKREGF
ncbi:hypothetical protein HPP92_003734 [Vanilla planifolia]|uniref:Uncharacterized protein n=1 Tax=Vanilla planifolia TaxID=51239 RepID=A0A835VLS5_VANPL|nr:hypothetical protein HPP92_003734 [Vanilla planifolia]